MRPVLLVNASDLTQKEPIMPGIFAAESSINVSRPILHDLCRSQKQNGGIILECVSFDPIRGCRKKAKGKRYEKYQ
jgi:hypothetical protein